MKLFSNFIVAAVIFTLAIAASGQTRSQRPARIADLAWIAGCWQVEGSKGRTGSEQWMSPAGGIMLGISRSLKDGKLEGYEFLRLVEENGAVDYISRPSGNTTDTAFRLVKWSPQEAIFENAQHDFPQRIIYRRSGSRLHARIEGTMSGKLSGADFSMVKGSCN